jgi:hypothetical protein
MTAPDLRTIVRDYDSEPVEGALALFALLRSLFYTLTWVAQALGVSEASTFDAALAYGVMGAMPEWFWAAWIGAGAALVALNLATHRTDLRRIGHLVLFAVSAVGTIAFALANVLSGAWIAWLGYTLAHAWCLYRLADTSR